MYFPGDPHNEKDYIFLIVPEEDRDRVIGQPAGDHAYRFDIVLRGRFQTPPDAD
jgi:protocatechuate 3,4-dioxygenase beta subunit